MTLRNLSILLFSTVAAVPSVKAQETWVQLTPANSPPPREYATMVYDAARQQVVLFGGAGADSFLSDTWIWNGINWIQESPATVPPSRDDSQMAYDAARQETVLFGGMAYAGGVADTWVWDGTNWSMKTPANSPSARWLAAMAYDAAHQQVVLFGGLSTSGSALSDTWVWDGTNWTQKFPSNSPPGRIVAGIAYDVANQNIVTFGGQPSLYGTPLADTWVWDGSNWTQRFPPQSPSARTNMAMAYDNSLQGVILFGGFYATAFSDTWLWNGTAWSLLSPFLSPPARWAAGMAYDAAHRDMVLFGGGGLLQDTWILVPATPTQLSALPSPASFGQPVTLTAVLTPLTATGTVTFYSGATILGSAPVIGGSAKLTTIALPAGTNSLHAYYGGDDADARGTSPTIAEIVNATPASSYVNSSGSPFHVGAGPFALVAADFNNDNKMDLAVANAAAASVTVLLGDGQGGFSASPGSPLATGNGSFSLGTGDFNGDGNMDLAVANAGDNTLTILLGNGSGGFAPAVGSPISTGQGPISLVVADFNGDGRADIAVANSDLTINLLLGNGDGSFSPAPIPGQLFGATPTYIAAGDFLGNGITDLIAAESAPNGPSQINFQYFYNQGNGTFDNERAFQIGSSSPVALAVADFNGDGYPDVAWADITNNYITILINSAGNGNGPFLPNPATYPVGISPESVAVGDFNGDGKLDLAVANSGSNNVYLLLGDGAGHFTLSPQGPIATGPAPFFVAVADFNGDGRADLAVVNFLGANVSVLLGAH